MAGGGCERTESPVTAKSPRIASFVPSATDLLIAGGMADHLVAVSNFDKANPAVSGQEGGDGGEKPGRMKWPSAGDYQTVDWERLSVVKPEVLLTFMARDRLPAGMAHRAERMGIRIENLKVETVADVLATWRKLGEITGEREKAERAVELMSIKLAAVEELYAGRSGGGPSGRGGIRTVMVLGDEPFTVIGAGTFLDELLTMVGGENAAAQLGGGKAYPTVDREQLKALGAEVVVHLLPSASEQRVAQVRRFWAEHPEIPGARGVRVLTHWSLLQPGAQLVRIATELGDAIHSAKQELLGRGELP